MAMEIADRIEHVETASPDSEFHTGPVGSDERLNARAQAQDNGILPVPTILDEGITIDHTGFAVLVKQRIIAKEVAQGPAE